MQEGTPSTTARRVATIRARMDRPVTTDGDDQIERLLVERFPVPDEGGLQEAIERRTTWFDSVTLRCIDGGIRQVVMVAAGYDCRALRFRSPGVRFIELDHPATQADKRRILAELGARCDDVAYAAADFTTDDIGAALAGAGHQPSAPTLFLAEGLLIYLPRDVILTLLRALRACAADGSRLAVSMSRAQSPAFYARVAAIGEHAHSTFTDESALELLEECGWTGDTSRTVVLATPA